MNSGVLGGLAIFKSLYDSAKAIKDINDAAIRNAAVIDLQEKILAAREAQSALLDRIGDLEKQIADFETWETEKQRYELKKVCYSGSTAYVLKPDAKGTEPTHCICAGCYDRGKNGRLQPVPGHDAEIHRKWACQECKTITQSRTRGEGSP